MTDKTTVDELLPCPWCGAKPIMVALENGYFSLMCDDENCPVICETEFNTTNYVIAAWNARTPAPPSDDLRAAMEALRASYSDAFGYAEFAVEDVLAAWDAQQGERS